MQALTSHIGAERCKMQNFFIRWPNKILLCSVYRSGHWHTSHDRRAQTRDMKRTSPTTMVCQTLFSAMLLWIEYFMKPVVTSQSPHFDLQGPGSAALPWCQPTRFDFMSSSRWRFFNTSSVACNCILTLSKTLATHRQPTKLHQQQCASWLCSFTNFQIFFTRKSLWRVIS